MTERDIVDRLDELALVMTERDFLSPPKAAIRAGVNERTMQKWCERVPGLAIRVVGRWRVNPAALERLLRGELQPIPLPRHQHPRPNSKNPATR